MSEYRDRATGWQHAKLSGHKNEDLVKEYLDNDDSFKKGFLKRINRYNQEIIRTSIGGLHEADVPGVNGKKTKSKTDLKVYLNNGEIINVSIKKSYGGQVYFVRAGLFIETYEKQFGTVIPENVQRAIKLFWKAADDAIPIIERYGDKTNHKNYELQIRHESLNATTLKTYDRSLYNALIEWFKTNAYNLAKLSFAMGAVANKEEWSEYVWYINLLDENNSDDIFHIERICEGAKRVSEKETYFSSTNGGTTIQLPFGFVQWHQGQMQFHHNFDKVKDLCK